MTASELYSMVKCLLDSDYLARRIDKVAGSRLRARLHELTITVSCAGEVVAGECVVFFEDVWQQQEGLSGINTIRFYMDTGTTIEQHELADAIVDAYTDIAAPVCVDWRLLIDERR